MTRPLLAAAALLAVLPGGDGSVAQPAPDPRLPRLTGVVIGNGERRAVFTDADGSFGSVAEGDQVGAYAVVAITPGAVRLQGPAGTYTLHPAPAAVAGAAPAAPPPAPPPTDAQRQAEADNNK